MGPVPALGEHTEAIRRNSALPGSGAGVQRCRSRRRRRRAGRAAAPGPAEALGGLLGVPVPDLAHGESLPPLWHWVYLLDRPVQADLGPDGHPVRGPPPAPPGPGRRRMWAGGRVQAQARCAAASCDQADQRAVGDRETGPLGPLLSSRSDIRSGRAGTGRRRAARRRLPRRGRAQARPAGAGGPVTRSPAGEDEWEVEVSPALLFRFSALTYNAHRIHYDRGYARDVEGYPGLLTHGPLQALAMAEAARAAMSGRAPAA